MNKLDKYKLKKKWKAIGRFSWDLLATFSKVVIFLFFMITAITFWINIGVEYFLKYEVNFMPQIVSMIWIVVIAVMLVAIDIIKNIKTK